MQIWQQSVMRSAVVLQKQLAEIGRNAMATILDLILTLDVSTKINQPGATGPIFWRTI